MSSLAQSILASLAASQAALSASQTALTEAYTATFGGSTPTKPKATESAPAKQPKAETPSNKSAKAEAKAAKRQEMRKLYGAEWHKTYTLHPVTLEPRLRSGAEEPKAATGKPKAPVTEASKAKSRRKATGKLAEKLAAKA